MEGGEPTKGSDDRGRQETGAERLVIRQFQSFAPDVKIPSADYGNV